MAKYKVTKQEITKVQIEGIFDITTMSVDVDGEKIDIANELGYFNGKSISLTFVEKVDKESDEKSEEDSDNE